MRKKKLRRLLAEEGLLRKASDRSDLTAASYSGNPDGKPIYPNEIDHGYNDPISGGSDVMVNLVEDLRREQGR